jgi:hypothetical protein
MTELLRFIFIAHVLVLGLLFVSAQNTIIIKHKPVTLGVHSSTDNGATSSATVQVGPITPTPSANNPSTIVCSVGYSNSATFTSITDNVNSGYYLPAASLMRDHAHNQIGGIYYHENVAAASTTITLTYSPAETHGRMACLELQGVPSAYGAESTFVAGQAGVSNSATTGSGLTPFGNGRFVYGLVLSEGGTASHGSGYTYLDTQTGTPSSQLLPEYQIQTSATNTNAPQSFSGSEIWGDWMAAWAPQQSGTCGLSAVIDWSGGTAGNTPAAADLNASTHGIAPQPNADRARNGGVGTNTPGWLISGTEQKTYTTSAYAPLQTQRNCPFYSGSGTTSNTLGLTWSTSNTSTGSDNSVLNFDTTSNIASVWACMMFNGPQTGYASARGDMFAVGRSDNSDYISFGWMGHNSGTWYMEPKGGGAQYTSFNWISGNWYGIRMIYNGTSTSASHSVSFYSYSGSKCTGTATLLGTLSAASLGAGPPNGLRVPLGEANSVGWPSGYNFYLGAMELDILYGATLVP